MILYASWILESHEYKRRKCLSASKSAMLYIFTCFACLFYVDNRKNILLLRGVKMVSVTEVTNRKYVD